MLQKYLIDVAIPHQSQIGSEEPICDSFPPGEAFGTFRNCKINYNLNFPLKTGSGVVTPDPVDAYNSFFRDRRLISCSREILARSSYSNLLRSTP